MPFMPYQQNVNSGWKRFGRQNYVRTELSQSSQKKNEELYKIILRNLLENDYCCLYMFCGIFSVCYFALGWFQYSYLNAV
jgi:hypothetical protein